MRLLLLPLLLLATAADDGFVRRGHPVMATWVELRLPAESAGSADAVLALFDDADARLSEWKDSSPLSAVNRAAGQPVAVPADLLALAERGVERGAATDGAFDITWAALWGVWDFRAKTPAVPDPALIEQRRAQVDYRRVVVDRPAGTLAIGAGQTLGLGGIAKGWTLDRAAAELRGRGIANFLITAGGQVVAGGTRAGSPWRVGIRDPRGAADDFFAVLAVQDRSVSTSGDYERCFVADGALHHHILDPRTGRPARGLRSVTVVSPDATLADAFSTALFVLGPERAKALVAKHADVEAVLVLDDGSWWASPGLGGLTLAHEPRREDVLPPGSCSSG